MAKSITNGFLARYTSSMASHLVEFWREMQVSDTTPNLHPQDKSISYSDHLTGNFNEYVSKRYFAATHKPKLHLGCVPVPYVGDIDNADCFLLMLNPGLAPIDLYAEYNVRQFRERSIGNLHQRNTDEYPFWCLDPDLCWTGGFSYWNRRLSWLIDSVAHARKQDELVARQEVAQRVAVLQMVPYHSTSDPGSKLRKPLVSSEEAIRFARERLGKDANQGRKLVIVLRQAANWGLQRSRNVIIPKTSRGAYMPAESDAGKALLARLSLPRG